MSRESPQSISPPQGSRHHSLGSDANIRNFAPVARIMKMALPDNAKIAKEAKECMQECVSEFISFITSEGTSFRLFPQALFPTPHPHTPLPSPPAPSGRPPPPPFFLLLFLELTIPKSSASEKCQHEKRKTVNGEDILFAMTSLGFENYAEALKIYLTKYREVSILSFLFFLLR